MSISEAILATLAYHDIFDYPLYMEEVNKLLISKKSSLSNLKIHIKKLLATGKIGEYKKLYYLKGRKSIIKVRLIRKKYSDKKFKKALIYSRILKLIPTIKLVAISGALSMENSSKKDDIDLVIITTANLLWTTRFLTTLILWPIKRKPNSLKFSNKVCLNLFFDINNVKISQQNIYIAHEIAQMKLIWDKDNAYTRFLRANKWVNKFLPNVQVNFRSTNKILANSKFTIKAIKFMENIFKNVQLVYMQQKITTERVGDKQIFFHPKNTQETVIKEFHQKLSKLGILASYPVISVTGGRKYSLTLE